MAAPGQSALDLRPGLLRVDFAPRNGGQTRVQFGEHARWEVWKITGLLGAK